MGKSDPCAGDGQCSFSQRWEDKGDSAEGALFVGLFATVFTAAQSDRALLVVSQMQGWAMAGQGNGFATGGGAGFY